MRIKKFAAIATSAMLAVSMLGACTSAPEPAETKQESNSTQDQTSEEANSTEEEASTQEASKEETQEAPTEEVKEELTGYTYTGSDKYGELTGLDAQTIVANMGFGFNIGNSLDATGGNRTDVFSHEQSWGNAIITQELVDSIYEQGFTTVRIPTTWANYVQNDGNYTIDPGYLARVREVVDYCYQHDMYVILNIHHEGWLNNKDMVNNEDQIAEEIGALWTQIAAYFAEYDQHLIFEGMNEPRLAGTDVEWGGNEDAYETVNYFSQTFANAVRSNQDGHNQERCLMIPGYAASNSEGIIQSVSVPTIDGEPLQNMILSVHCYSPYEFCLSDSMKDFDPENSACTSAIDKMFSTIYSAALSQGIPCVIGETSATNKDNTEARERWATYMGEKAAGFGTPIVIWDNGYDGNSGGECHGYFNRATAECNYPTIFAAMMKAKEETAWGSLAAPSEGEEGESETFLGGIQIVSYEDGKTSKNTWDADYIRLGASETYFAGEKSIAVIYTGDSEPKLILDSEALSQYWMPVDPDHTEDLGDKKVTYFSAEGISKVLESFGVERYSQLRDLCIVATDSAITTYAIEAVGTAPCAVYKVNGKSYYTGTDMPEDPVVDHMEFLGWYTTKTYDEGTEFNPDNLTEDVVVYAKLGLKK